MKKQRHHGNGGADPRGLRRGEGAVAVAATRSEEEWRRRASRTMLQ